MQKEKRQHKELMNNIIEVRQYDYTEGYKITVKYASGATRTYKNEPSWFMEYIEDSWSIMQETFNVYGSYEHIHNNYSPVELSTPEEVEEVEEVATPEEIAARATGMIYSIVSNMPDNSGIEYSMKAIHVKPTNNNTFVVIADTERFGKNQIMFESYDIMQCVEYVRNAIHTTPADPEVQEITSADTSINSESVPVVFSTLAEKANKLNITLENSVVFDTGCGKYPEIISDFFKASNTDYIGRDKFNQPENINNIWVDNCKAAGSVGLNRIFTSSNVMNVIKGEKFRIEYLKDIMQYMKPGEKLYITVYDGDRSGVGRVTKTEDGIAKCWQENRKYKDYIPECMKAGFTTVTPKYNMLICEL